MAFTTITMVASKFQIALSSVLSAWCLVWCSVRANPFFAPGCPFFTFFSGYPGYERMSYAYSPGGYGRWGGYGGYSPYYRNYYGGKF